MPIIRMVYRKLTVFLNIFSNFSRIQKFEYWQVWQEVPILPFIISFAFIILVHKYGEQQMLDIVFMETDVFI